MKKSKINIISELNKLKEEFSFQPRRIKERNQQKIEIHDKKLKQLQEKTPIGTVISISYFHKNKIDRYDVNDLFDNSDREYREPNLLRIDLEEDAAQEYKFVTVSEVFSVNELVNDYSDILFLVKCRSLYTNEEQLCYYESEDSWRMEEDAFGMYFKGIMKYYKQEEKNSYVYEAFSFKPRKVEGRKERQKEYLDTKEEVMRKRAESGDKYAIEQYKEILRQHKEILRQQKEEKIKNMSIEELAVLRFKVKPEEIKHYDVVLGDEKFDIYGIEQDYTEELCPYMLKKFFKNTFKDLDLDFRKIYTCFKKHIDYASLRVKLLKEYYVYGFINGKEVLYSGRYIPGNTSCVDILYTQDSKINLYSNSKKTKRLLLALKENFKFQPRRVKERQVKQEEIENKKKEQFKQEVLRLENTFQNKFQIITEDLHPNRYFTHGFYSFKDFKSLVNLNDSETVVYEYPIHYWETNIQGSSNRIFYVSLKVCEGKDKALIQFKQLGQSSKTFFLCKKDEYEEYFYLKELKLIDNLNELMPKENLKEDFKFTPRRIQSREEEKTKKLELLLQQTHIEDNLFLRGTKITSLGNLTSVGGYLDLENCTNLTSLGNLESVGDDLNLYGCTNLSSLGNLTSVEGYFDLYGCTNLSSLGNLKSVGSYLDFVNCKNLTSLGNLRSVGSSLYLNGNITYIDPSIIIKGKIYKGQNVFKSIESFNKFYQKENLKEEFKFQPRRIEGREDERNNKLNELLKQEIIEGDLNLVGSSVTSLGNVRIIRGNLNAERVETLTDISSLQMVQGGLDLEFTNVKELPKNLVVKGSIFIKKTPIVYIDPSVKYYGSLNKFFYFDSIVQFNEYNREYREKLAAGLIKEESKFKFQPRRIQGREEEKIKKLELLLQQTHIKGYFDLTNSNITSLRNLQCVGSTLRLFDCKNLTSLGNLKFVDGALDLYGCTNLSSLGNLESVGGYLDLRGTKITSLGKLKFVDGVLNLGNTNITYIDPSIIIKGRIWKGMGWFSTIQRFNKYYQDKQNLKENFKFQPRRIEDREEKRKEREQILINKFIETYGTFEEFKTMILKELSVYIQKGLKVSIQDELYLENYKNYNINMKFHNFKVTCFLFVGQEPWFSSIYTIETMKSNSTIVSEKDFLKTLKKKAEILLNETN